MSEKKAFSLQTIFRILERAGERILSCREKESIEAMEKEGVCNYVTKFDVEIQAYIEGELKELLPEAVFFAEEMDREARGTGEITVYLDPVDGTANLIRGNRNTAISLAIAQGGRLKFGAVYAPDTREMFYAERGKGAFLNGRPIQVSRRSLPEAVMMAGTASYYKEALGKQTMRLIAGLYEKTADLRRYGSAALEMCQVACGRAEFSFEMKLYPWDYAAGWLIVQEAGGIVTDLDGGKLPLDRSSSVLCCNRIVYDEVLTVCKDIG